MDSFITSLDTKHLPTYQRDLIDFIYRWLSPEPTLTAYTSGTTGTPTSIEISKVDMMASASRTIDFLSLTSTYDCVICLPVEFIAGMMMVVRACVGQMNIWCIEPSTSPALYMVPEDKNSFVALTPLQVSHTPSSDLDKLNTIIIGGGAISPSIEDKIQALSSVVYHTYGSTETLSHVAMRQLAPAADKYFTALEGVKFRTNKMTSCLLITDDTLGIQELHTTDIVELIDSTHFVWKARADDVINSGGRKLYPLDIEHKLNACIPVRFFVSGVDNETLGSEVVLVVEQTSPFVQRTLDSIALCVDRHEKPRRIIYLTPFRYTQTDKIKRKETLQLALASGTITRPTYTPSISDT